MIIMSWKLPLYHGNYHGELEITCTTIGPVKQKKRKIAIIFLHVSISLNMCFGCSKEPSHRYGSYEYPQHMFWLRNKKNNFQLRTLIRGPDNASKMGPDPLTS